MCCRRDRVNLFVSFDNLVRSFPACHLQIESVERSLLMTFALKLYISSLRVVGTQKMRTVQSSIVSIDIGILEMS